MIPKVLIVDDNTEFRTMIKEYISKNDLRLEVYEASTGEMAVAKASFVKPDIILMDISLPNANGLTATKHLKEDHPDCDVIVVTMFDTKEFKNLSKRFNVTDFIGKNDIYDQLIPVINRCLNKREKQQLNHVK